jgi:DNA-directed RNA polymerase specialized sigma24 family protein
VTPTKTYFFSSDRIGRRREFTDFYSATYPAVVGEMLALTGDLEVAHAVVSMSYVRAWQAWPAVRTLDWPVMWVRSDAVRRLRRPPRAPRLLENGGNAIEPVRLAPEDQALIAGLRWLPAEQRLFLVLHDMAQVPASTIAEWFGGTVEDIETALDTGFDALVSILEQTGGVVDGARPHSDLPDEATAIEAQARYDEVWVWTEEALNSCGHRLRTYLPTPPPTAVFRRAAVTKVARRGAPAGAAAAAACIGLTAWLSPAPSSTAEAESLASPPPTFIEQPAPAGRPLAMPPLGTSATAPLLRITHVAGATLTSGMDQTTPLFAPAARTTAEGTTSTTTLGPPAATTTTATTDTASTIAPAASTMTPAATGTTSTTTTPATTTTTTTPATTAKPTTTTDPDTTSVAPSSETTDGEATRTTPTTTSGRTDPTTDQPTETTASPTSSTRTTTASTTPAETTTNTPDTEEDTTSASPSP